MVCVGNCGRGCHNFTGSVIQIWSKVISRSVLQVSCLGLKKKNTTLCVKSCLSCSSRTSLLRYLLTKPRRGEADLIPPEVLVGSVRTPSCSTEDKPDPHGFASGL